jgi:arsenite methyltransferase
MMQEAKSKPEYGIDAPGVIRNLFVAGVAGIAFGRFVPDVTVGGVTLILKPMFWNTGIGCLIAGVLMLLYARFGKFGHRDRMLNAVQWRGDERVLDVGTGAGLLLIGAAKRITTGRAVGIDLWSRVDLSGNGPERVLRNAELEGVSEKIEVVSGDATEMKFADGSFDVVVSNLCIHNIPSKEGREKACREIVRVLKPGGKIVISDFIHTGEYVKAFKAAGMEMEPGISMSWSTFPPLRILKGKKPA